MHIFPHFGNLYFKVEIILCTWSCICDHQLLVTTLIIGYYFLPGIIRVVEEVGRRDIGREMTHFKLFLEKNRWLLINLVSTINLGVLKYNIHKPQSMLESWLAGPFRCVHEIFTSAHTFLFLPGLSVFVSIQRARTGLLALIVGKASWEPPHSTAYKIMCTRGYWFTAFN